MDWLGRSLGVKFIQKSGNEQLTLSSLIQGSQTSDFKPIDGFMYAGDMAFSDIPAELLHKLALDRNGQLDTYAVELAKIVGPQEGDTRKFLAKKIKVDMAAPMPQSQRKSYHMEFFNALQLDQKSSPDYRYTFESLIMAYYIPTLIIYKYIYEQTDPKNFNRNSQTARDYHNWKNFVLSDTSPFSRFFSKALSTYIDFEAFKEHGYILGATKAGKTELLKVIAHHIITNTMRNNPKAGGIIVDPHGDFSKEVSLFRECSNNDRIILFDPSLYPDKTPSLDIFYTPDLEDKTIEVIADNLVSAFDEIIADTSISANMKALLVPCVSVLLRRPNSSIGDLQRFMLPESSTDLLELGQRSPNKGQAEFFKNGFHLKKYDPTKTAIYTRLQILQNSKVFSRIVNPKGTLSIERELNNGKFIIMNLSKGAMSPTVSKAFGRLVIASAKAAGLRREDTPIKERAESYIFVDECQNFISESMDEIFEELRKYGVHLIMANQYIGQDMSTKLVKSILSNTGVKITGKNANATNSVMAKELGIDIEELNKLTMGRFCAHVKQKHVTQPFVFPAPKHCLGMSNYMGKENWAAQKRKGWSCYVSNQVLDASQSACEEPLGVQGSDTASADTEAPQGAKYTPKFDL